MAAVSARQRLLDAAVEAFAEKGFTATTTRDIAARAKMSPAAVYVHHDSKESLLYSVSLTGHQAALAVLRDSARSSAEPIARLHTMVSDFTRWHAENSRVGRIVQYEFQALNAEHRREIASIRRDIEACMRAALEDGVRDGSMVVDDVAGTALALLALGIDVVRWFDPTGPRTGRELGSLYAGLAVRMVQDRESASAIQA